MKYLFFLFFAFAFASSYSQQLTYKAKNPNFGGETFNYQWLLSSANAQNSFTDPNDNNDPFRGQSELDQFASNLNRQLLSQISRGLFDINPLKINISFFSVISISLETSLL